MACLVGVTAVLMTGSGLQPFFISISCRYGSIATVFGMNAVHMFLPMQLMAGWDAQRRLLPVLLLPSVNRESGSLFGDRAQNGHSGTWRNHNYANR